MATSKKCNMCHTISKSEVQAPVYDCLCGQTINWCLFCLRDALKANKNANGDSCMTCPHCQKTTIHNPAFVSNVNFTIKLFGWSKNN